MVEIKPFSTPKLRHEEFFNFCKTVIEIKNYSIPLDSEHQELFKALMAAIDAFDEELKNPSKNPHQVDINEAILMTEDTWRGVRSNMKSMKSSPLEEIKKISTRVFDCIEKYGNLPSMSQGAMYGSLENLLQDLNGFTTAEKEKVMLQQWIDGLVLSQQKYTSAMMSAVNFENDLGKGQTKLRRDELDDEYRMLVKRVNATQLLTPDLSLEKFIKELNIVIDKEKTMLAKRQTRAESKKEKDMEEPVVSTI